MSALLLAAEEGNGYWLPHDIREVFWASLAFFIVAGVLWWKAVPPARTAMATRSQRIQDELDAATAQRLEGEAERDRIRAAVADADSEAARIVEEARVTADRLITSIEERTEEDVGALRARAALELESLQRQSIADLTAEVSRLSFGATERIVSENLDERTQSDLIDDYIEQVGRNPN